MAVTNKMGTGRRKTAVARVILKNGKGELKVNGHDIETYFKGRKSYINKILMPLKVTETLGKFDIRVKVEGGGLTGQSDSVSLGIARALLQVDENFRKPLRAYGLLTRDQRMVERKKYGLRKARRSRQYSKR